MSFAPTAHRHIAELDGIRAIAVWMVLVCHIFYGWRVAPGTFHFIPRPLLEVISHGWLGVDLFFLLSGFLITGILLDSRERPGYFRLFYLKRAVRILPLYFACVAVWCFAYPLHLDYFALATAFSANMAGLFDVGIPHGPGVLWSLAVEEHFYILWPVVVFWLPRRALTIVAFLIITLTPISRALAAYHGMEPSDIYLLSWFRFDGLALGGLLAIWVRSQFATRALSHKLALLLVAIALVITAAGWPFGIMREGIMGSGFRYTQAQLVFAGGMLVALANQGSRLTSILRGSFLRVTAELSYCLYLVHLSIGDGVEYLMRSWGYTGEGLESVLLRGAAILVLSFAVAGLSRRYLEQPALRLKRYF